MRKLLILATVSLLFVSLAAMPSAAVDPGPVLTVSGLVKQPLRLTLADLERLPAARVELNDVRRDGSFHGSFRLQGVPLRDLLALAQVGKEGHGFDRCTDLAVVVKNAQGQQVTLSWGEICRHDPGQAILALSSSPVLPYKGPEAFSDPAAYRKLMAQIERRPGLPKLVLARDFATDRGLENVVSLRVVEPVLTPQPPRPKTLYSPTLSVVGPEGKEHRLEALPPLPRRTVTANMVGPGRGFHGQASFSGVALADLLNHFKQAGDAQSAVVISAPDGYASLISWGELFLGSQGQRILLADRMDGKPIAKQGRFALVAPDDFLSDRWVMAPAKLQVVRLGSQPRVSVIGVGCGDSNLITLEALDAIAQADVLVAPQDIQKRFAPYLLGKPVIFDPMAQFAKKPPKKASEEAHKDSTGRHMYEDRVAEAGKIIKAQLAQGKNVAILDWGDPMIYGSWRWIKDVLPQTQEIRFVGGLSAFNAGSAAIRRDIACSGIMAITDPFTMFKNPDLLKTLAAKGATLVIFMALPRFPQVMAAVQAAYPPDTPAAVVYRAGMQTQEVVKSRLDQVLKANPEGRERWLGVVYVGPCLR